MTLEIIEQAERSASNQLTIMLSGSGDQACLAYAGGLVGGVANFLSRQFGARAAYDVIQGIADCVVVGEGTK